MELNALMSSMFYMQTLSQKYNPFHKELVEQNWEKARIVLHTLVKDDTEFHRLLIEEKTHRSFFGFIYQELQR